MTSRDGRREHESSFGLGRSSPTLGGCTHRGRVFCGCLRIVRDLVPSYATATKDGGTAHFLRSVSDAGIWFTGSRMTDARAQDITSGEQHGMVLSHRCGMAISQDEACGMHPSSAGRVRHFASQHKKTSSSEEVALPETLDHVDEQHETHSEKKETGCHPIGSHMTQPVDVIRWELNKICCTQVADDIPK